MTPIAQPDLPAGTPDVGSPEARAMRLQILGMENQTLLAHRAQLWSDFSGRATMFLAVLSGAVLAIALAAQATAFDARFFLFVILVLPTVLFVGLTTLGRMRELNEEDFRVVQSLARMRQALLELDPGIRPYLAMSPYDDWHSLSRMYAASEELTGRRALAHGLRTLPATFAVINCVVAATLAASIAINLGLDGAVVVGAGLVVFFGLFMIQSRGAIRMIDNLETSLVSLYPAPRAEAPPASVGQSAASGPTPLEEVGGDR